MNGSLEHQKGSDEHSKGKLRSKQKKNATIKSRAKGHPLNNSKYPIGEELEYKLEDQYKYSSHAIMVLGKKTTKRKKEDIWPKSCLHL